MANQTTRIEWSPFSDGSNTASTPWTIIVALTVTFVTTLHWFLIDRVFLGRSSHIPGPKLAALTWWYITYFDLRLCRNQTIAKWHKIYGPVVRVRPNEVTLTDPRDFRQVYGYAAKYDKTLYFKRFRLHGEDNLFSTVDYGEHRAMKRRIAAAYSKSNVVTIAQDLVRERVTKFLTLLSDAAVDANDNGERGGLIDFFVVSDCFSHDVMTRFLYGTRHGTDAICNPADRLLVAKLKRSQLYSPIWANFLWLYNSWFLKAVMPDEFRQTVSAVKDVGRHIDGLIDRHDADAGRDDEVSLYRTMRLYRGPGGEVLNRNYMASEMFDHLKAGQQTTATTLMFMFWRLSREPEWQSRIRDEAKALSEPSSIADLDSCPVLDAVIKESLRVHHAASGRSERVVPKGGRTYSGVFVPEGTTVIGLNPVVMRNEKAFPDPDAWKPERWMQPVSPDQAKEMELSFVPFGYGSRMCIGQHLAMLELKMLTSAMYRRFSTTPGETCTDESMEQLSSLAAVPRGLKCELYVKEV